MKTSRRFLNRFYLYLVLAFFYLPIFVLIFYSFNASKSRTVWGGFTLKWYGKLFSDQMILNSVYVTLAVSVLAALIATALGTAAAIGIMAMKKRMRTVFVNVTYLPILSPEIIMGVSLMLLFVWACGSLNFGTLLLAHVSFDTPYVIFSVMPKLRQLDPHLYEAAQDLGAHPATAFRKVVLPQIRPGIITGMLLAFTLSVDDFVISYFTSGDNSQTLSIAIYAMTRKRVSPEINALSTLLFLFVLLFLIIINVRQAGGENSQQRKEIRDEI
ncbi:MAG TPA: ABC transporter permease [Clostridia bacterium]|nr:ABC transporter permease [Clostridia bacterium]